jgi:hypothetical protein
MKLLYILLLVSTFAVLGTAAAMYLRVRRQLKAAKGHTGETLKMKIPEVVGKE